MAHPVQVKVLRSYGVKAVGGLVSKNVSNCLQFRLSNKTYISKQ